LHDASSKKEKRRTKAYAEEAIPVLSAESSWIFCHGTVFGMLLFRSFNVVSECW